MQTINKLHEEIAAMPVVDIHTHVDLTHESARGLSDVLLYHMVISELYSSGCPDGARLSEWPDDNEAERRIINALPCLKHIKYTSAYSMAKGILSGLYGWDKETNLGNWREIDGIIREKYASGYASGILDKANIEYINTEYCRRGDKPNSRYFYGLEWAFFTRSQYGAFDAPLIELEVASSQDEPLGPLPVNIDRALYAGVKKLKTPEDIDAAIGEYVRKIPLDKIAGMATHFSTDIKYRDIPRDELALALKNRDSAGPPENDVYANYINQKYMEALNALGVRISFAVSLGAEPLKFETGVKLVGDTLYAIERLANEYKNIDILVYNACGYMDDALCSIIREAPNVYAAGYWWHNFYPSAIETIIRSRIERLPLNKWFGYFSDAYCVDWAWAKLKMIKRAMAKTLAGMVDDGFISYNDAAGIASALLRGNAMEYFKLGDNDR